MKAFLISLLILSTPTWAAKIKDAKCSDVGSVTPRYLAVMDGYDRAGKLVSEEVDMGGLITEAQKVNENCTKDTSAKIASIRKDIKTTGENPATTRTINPMRAKCSEFLALGEDVQPIAAFWVAGHDKQGKLKRGEVDEEFLTRPVAALIEDCKSQPTASFYDKTKAWVKKHL